MCQSKVLVVDSGHRLLKSGNKALNFTEYGDRSRIHGQICLRNHGTIRSTREFKLSFPLFLLTMVSQQTGAIQLDAEARFSILSRG